MAAVAVQLTTTLTMAHDLILLSKTLTCDPVTRQRCLPVASFRAHAQRQSTGSQHVFNLSKRFFTKVRRFKELNLGTLYQITDIVDSFCFKGS